MATWGEIAEFTWESRELYTWELPLGQHSSGDVSLGGSGLFAASGAAYLVGTTMAIPKVTSSIKAGLIGGGTLSATPGSGINWIAILIHTTSHTKSGVPSGWTQVRTVTANSYTVMTMYKATSNPGVTSWTMTEAGGWRPSALIILGFDSELTETNYGQNVTATSLVSPSVTTSVPDALILRLIADFNDSLNAVGYPTNATLYRDQIVQPEGDNTWAASIGVAFSEKAAAGSVGTATWSLTAPYAPYKATIAFTGVQPGPGEEYSGTAEFSGEGTLSLSGGAGFADEALLSGSGLLVVSGQALHTAEGIVELSGAGTIEAEVAGLNLNQDVGLSGAGTLAAAGTPRLVNTVGLSGSGSLSVSGDKLQEEAGSVDLSGDGGLSISVVPNPRGSASLSGSGSLSVSGFADVNGTVTLGGVATLQVRDFTKVGPGNWTRADDEKDYLENMTGLWNKTLADLRHIYWKSILLKERTNHDLEKEFQELRLQVLYNQYTLGDLQAVDPKYYEED